MNDKEREKRIRDTMCKCRHFTGIQHDCCKANVNYHDQFGREAGCFAKLPCIYEDTTKTCSLRSPYSEVEAREIEDEADKAIAEFLDCIATGKCPHCKTTVHQRQVGHCVYGVECGHRMYQGMVNPEFAEGRS